MTKRLPKVLTAVTLAAQLLLATHTAFVVHSAVNQHRAAEASHVKHGGRESTWCAEQRGLKPADDFACTAAQFSAMASELRLARAPVASAALKVESSARLRFTHRTVPVLTLAPKASPPERAESPLLLAS